MKILVTGGAGFIGSHLDDALIARGHHITVVDNLILGRKENIAHLMDAPNFKFVEADILDAEAMHKLFEEGSFEMVYHLAANSDISYLVNLFVSRLYSFSEKNIRPKTLIISNDSFRTTVNISHIYKLKQKNIRLSILDETFKAIEALPESYDYAIGYLLGMYSEDRKQIFVCFAIQNDGASDALEEKDREEFSRMKVIKRQKKDS